MRFTAIFSLAMASFVVVQSGTTWLSEVGCEEQGDGYIRIPSGSPDGLLILANIFP